MAIISPRVELCGYILATCGGTIALCATYEEDYHTREIAIAIATLGVAALQPANTVRNTVAIIGATLTAISAATQAGITLSTSSITFLATHILKEIS